MPLPRRLPRLLLTQLLRQKLCAWTPSRLVSRPLPLLLSRLSASRIHCATASNTHIASGSPKQKFISNHVLSHHSSAFTRFSSTLAYRESIPKMSTCNSLRFLSKTDISFDGSVSAYVSDRTGLRCLLVDTPNDIIRGYFAFATRDEDGELRNRGLPHTLEHLVFMGSKSYPYKGVLDSLANLSLAQGTNAWTATDHTCYTIETAGIEGFCNMLPVYLEHLFKPTLTDSSFVTEIYNIDGKAAEGGVVFSEMQAVENTAANVGYKAILAQLYSKDSAYAAETGGLLEGVRKLTIESIRDYHAKYYRPENFCAIVVGSFDQSKLLETLSAYDKTLPDLFKKNTLLSPWKNYPVAAFEQETVVEKFFPDAEDGNGDLMIGFLSTEISNTKEQVILDILLTYLTDGPLSPLVKEFVDCPEPFCSSVSYAINEFKEVSAILHFESVEPADLDKLYIDAKRVIDTHKIDMDLLQSIIKQVIISITESIENNPAKALSKPSITSFLYGCEKFSNISSFFDTIVPSKEIQNLKLVEWQEFYDKLIGKMKKTIVKVSPSKELSDKKASEETSELSKRKTEIGEQGLTKMQQKIDDAMAKNNVPVPVEVLKAFPNPRTTLRTPDYKIASLPPMKSNDVDLQAKLAPYSQQLGFPIYVMSVGVSTVRFKLILDCSTLPKELHTAMRVFVELFFKCGVVHPDTGVVMSHTEVLNKIQKISATREAEMGWGQRAFATGHTGTQLVVHLSCLREDYAQLVEMVRAIALGINPTVERVRTVVQNLLQEATLCEREGQHMCAYTLEDSVFKSDTIQSQFGYHVQKKYLRELKTSLDATSKKNEDHPILAQIQAIRDAVMKPQNMRVIVSSNLEKKSTTDSITLDSLVLPFSSFFSRDKKRSGQGQAKSQVATTATNTEVPACICLENVRPIPHDHEFFNELGEHPNSKVPVRLIEMAAVESGYLLSLGSCKHAKKTREFAALMLGIEYATRSEGIMWRGIRGPGLAYGYWMLPETNTRTIYYMLYRSAKLCEAFSHSRVAVEAAIAELESNDTDGNVALGISSARSSLIYQFVRKLDSPYKRAAGGIYNILLECSDAHLEGYLAEQLYSLSAKEAAIALREIVLPLFSPETALVVATTSQSRAKETAEDFSKLGYNLNVVKP